MALHGDNLSVNCHNFLGKIVVSRGFVHGFRFGIFLPLDWLLIKSCKLSLPYDFTHRIFKSFVATRVAMYLSISCLIGPMAP